MIEDIFKT